MDKYLLIDCNHICHMAMYKVGNFSYKGKPTGVVFGFLREMFALVNRHQTDKFLFAWDSRQNIRKIRNVLYKANRRTDKTEAELKELFAAFEQFSELREYVLPKFGFKNIYLQTGYEADDIIAKICQENQDNELVIVSSDNDLWQLLTLKHYMYDVKKKKNFGVADFKKEWDIEPKQWGDVKAFAGCTTDDLKGIPGVGNKKAVKYLKKELTKGKIFDRIVSDMGKDIVEQNKPLVILPMDGTSSCYIKSQETFFMDDFLDICKEFGFKSFLNQKDIWFSRFDMR